MADYYLYFVFINEYHRSKYYLQSLVVTLLQGKDEVVSEECSSPCDETFFFLDFNFSVIYSGLLFQ